MSRKLLPFTNFVACVGAITDLARTNINQQPDTTIQELTPLDQTCFLVSIPHVRVDANANIYLENGEILYLKRETNALDQRLYMLFKEREDGQSREKEYDDLIATY